MSIKRATLQRRRKHQSADSKVKNNDELTDADVKSSIQTTAKGDYTAASTAVRREAPRQFLRRTVRRTRERSRRTKLAAQEETSRWAPTSAGDKLRGGRSHRLLIQAREDEPESRDAAGE